MNRFTDRNFLLLTAKGRALWRSSHFLQKMVAVAMAWLSFQVLSMGAQDQPTENEVKAAYLYQFGKFVDWPEGASANSGNDFAICTLGVDPFGRVLDQIISGRSVQGRKVVVKRLSNVNDASDCNILFVGSSEQNRTPEILKAVQGKGILTVGDKEGFVTQGGMIQFQIEQNKVRFEINLPAVERSNLKVSSQLLKVASVVNE